MTDESMHVDPGTLERLASRLRQGESELSGPAEAAPEVPDAGASTGPLAGVFSEIAKGMLGLGAEMTETADKVADSRGTYQDTDQDNAADLRRQQPD